MIEFQRKECAVNIHIDLDIPGLGRWDYVLSRNENNIPNAQLTINAMKATLREKLKSIREKAYAEGWKDAKAKTKKQDWFYGWF